MSTFQLIITIAGAYFLASRFVSFVERIGE